MKTLKLLSIVTVLILAFVLVSCSDKTPATLEDFTKAFEDAGYTVEDLHSLQRLTELPRRFSVRIKRMLNI